MQEHAPNEFIDKEYWEGIRSRRRRRPCPPTPCLQQRERDGSHGRLAPIAGQQRSESGQQAVKLTLGAARGGSQNLENCRLRNGLGADFEKSLRRELRGHLDHSLPGQFGGL